MPMLAGLSNRLAAKLTRYHAAKVRKKEAKAARKLHPCATTIAKQRAKWRAENRRRKTRQRREVDELLRMVRYSMKFWAEQGDTNG